MTGAFNAWDLDMWMVWFIKTISWARYKQVKTCPGWQIKK